MRNIGSFVKTLLVILTLTAGFTASIPASKAYAQNTCNPQILAAMKDRAEAVAQRNIQVLQSEVARPDAAANMVCLGEQLLSAAGAIGKIFSDNPQFKGSCSIGSMSGDTIDAIANTLVKVVSLYNLGGGTLNISFEQT